VIPSHLVLGPLFEEFPHPQAFLASEPYHLPSKAKQSKAKLFFFFFKGIFVCSQTK
jgi:hypothetical protein